MTEKRKPIIGVIGFAMILIFCMFLKPESETNFLLWCILCHLNFKDTD